MSAPVAIKVNAPEVVTKELSIYRTPAGVRKLRLSSNFLPLFGFEKETRFVADPLPGATGMRLRYAPGGRMKIHERRYNRRRNNPFETQIDIASQSLLDAAVPKHIERVHFTIRHGEILIKPLANRTFLIRKYLRETSNPFKAFIGLTSGVDVHCLQSIGFDIDTVLEYRPNEARDTTDLSETGALNILANAAPRVVINQSIYDVDWNHVEEIIDLPSVGLIHLSPQCDDFSNVKANSLKDRSVLNLDSTRDMFMDCLRAIEVTRAGVVLIENVPGFATSTECDLMRMRLRRMGYHVHDSVFDARDFGGLTSRKRFYLVATIWPGFEFPRPKPRLQKPIWDVVSKHLADCRDVSHTSSVAGGVATGRIRVITQNSTSAPTITKSQNRQAKDSVYIEKDGRFFLPSEALMRELMGVPEDFNLNAVGSTIASEIIGQSIEYPLHHAIARACYNHIAINTGHCSITRYAPKSVQMSLFT